MGKLLTNLNAWCTIFFYAFGSKYLRFSVQISDQKTRVLNSLPAIPWYRYPKSCNLYVSSGISEVGMSRWIREGGELNCAVVHLQFPSILLPKIWNANKLELKNNESHPSMKKSLYNSLVSSYNPIVHCHEAGCPDCT